jgi:hypothetical protein
MLGIFLDKLNVFFDRRFMLAYWSPIFIFLALAAGLAALLAGPTGALGWWTERSGTEQLILGVGILLVITVLAYVLGILTTPIVRLYEGYWPKGALTDWACKVQKARKAKLSDLEKLSESEKLSDSEKLSESEAYRTFPLDSDLVKPTRLGNVLVSAEEYPYQLYRLDAVLWWPRLATLLPDTFRSQVDTTLTPMLAMLNLTMLLTLLAFGGGVAVLLTNRLWWLFCLVFLGGLLLAWGCYLTATIQAVDYGELIRVAFDLYRYDVLKQMHIPLPDNLFQERLLWDMLNKWLYSYAPPWENGPVSNAPQPADPFYNDNHKAPTPAVQPQEIILNIED